VSEIIGKHATRDDVPYIVRHPSEGAFVVSRNLIIKLDGLREISKYGWPILIQGRQPSGHFYLRIVRKGGSTTHYFEGDDGRVERDWIYRLVVGLIEQRSEGAGE
jgi:hypothetical protein